VELLYEDAGTVAVGSFAGWSSNVATVLLVAKFVALSVALVDGAAFAVDPLDCVARATPAVSAPNAVTESVAVTKRARRAGWRRFVRDCGERT